MADARGFRYLSKQAITTPRRQLTLFDTTCIIVGIIIGAGIYETTPLIASNVSTPGMLIWVWCLGGFIALVGALCYVELSSTYPYEGGDYVFLSRAYGSKCGLLFAWAEYWIIRPGNVGMMAFVFARFANDLYPLRLVAGSSRFDFLTYANGSIVLLTALNLLGVRSGKLTQNILTSIKVLGLFAIFVIGMLVVPARPAADVAASSAGPANFQLALILVLFTYGGWNEVSYVAAEVREPGKNIFRSLVLGTLLITAIYVAVNVSFIRTLGLEDTRTSEAVAADVLRLRFGDRAGRMMSLLVCLSCLGSINGMVFTGSRVFYAAGADHKLVAWLGKWSGRFDTPLRALLVQLAVTLALVIGFGWYEQGFERLLHFTAPVFWFFAALVGLSLFILRWKDPKSERPYRVFLYPLTPALFCVACVFLFHSSFTYAWANRSVEAQWTLGILIAGIAIICLVPGVNARAEEQRTQNSKNEDQRG